MFMQSSFARNNSSRGCPAAPPGTSVSLVKIVSHLLYHFVNGEEPVLRASSSCALTLQVDYMHYLAFHRV